MKFQNILLLLTACLLAGSCSDDDNDGAWFLPRTLQVMDAKTDAPRANEPLTLNFIAIVLAIIGTLNPDVGALVHNAGSVLVITNSALLLKWRRTASQISRPQTRNLFDRKFRRQARRNLLFARSACRSRPAGGKARSAANPFQKEWIAKLRSTLFDFLLFSAPDRGH